MNLVPKEYTDPVGRPYEIIGGLVCAAVGALFLAFFAWFVLSVYSVGNLFQFFPAITAFVSIVFASGFLSIAYKLLSGKAHQSKKLLTKFTLYLMGWLFLTVSIAMAGVFVYERLYGGDSKGAGSASISSLFVGLGALRLARYRKDA